MKLTLHVPGLVWPDAHDGAEVSRELSLPALTTLLGRGRVIPAAGAPSSLLGEVFGVSGAALARHAAQADGLDAGDGHWLIADPVHLRIDRDRALLADVGVMSLSQGDANALVASLNRHFAEDGLQFHAPRPGRWYVHLPAAPQAHFTPLMDAVGEDINRHLPGGEQGLLWSRWLNEMQMLLFSHPVNEEREARGDLAVNSVWLWGGGEEPVVQRCGDLLLTDDTTLQLLANVAGTPHDALPYRLEAALARAAGQGRVDELRVTPDSAEAPAQFRDVWGWREAQGRLEENWFAPALAALRDGRLAALSIRTTGNAGFSCSVSRRDLWKFWRRPVSLSHLY